MMLNELNELNGMNNDEIKEMIIKKFVKKSGPRKNYGFYKIVSKLYPTHPDTVKDILKSVPTWGYYKDYMFFLLACRNNKEMTEYIYDILVERLNQDINEKNENKSMLSKWLPREGSSFDKKLNFVITFCKAYKKKQNKNMTKKKYRKLISSISKNLGVFEQKMNKSFVKNDGVEVLEMKDYEKMSNHTLKCNITSLKNNEENKLQLVEHLKNKYSKYKLNELINEMMFYNKTEFEKGIIEEIWRDKKEELLNNLNEEINKTLLETEIIENHNNDNLIHNNFNIINFENSDVLIDLDVNIYNKKLLQDTIAIMLLALYKKANVMLNSKTPYKINYELDKLDKLIVLIKSNMIDTKKLSIEKLIHNKLMKNDKLYILSNNENKKTDIDMSNEKNYKEIIYWILKKEKLKRINKIKYTGALTLSNKSNYRLEHMENILKKSEELQCKTNMKIIWIIIIAILCIVINFFFINK